MVAWGWGVSKVEHQLEGNLRAKVSDDMGSWQAGDRCMNWRYILKAEVVLLMNDFNSEIREGGERRGKIYLLPIWEMY